MGHRKHPWDSFLPPYVLHPPVQSLPPRLTATTQIGKIDYDDIWRLLKDEEITHFNAAPTINTLLCASPKAQRLPHEVRVAIGGSPPTPKLLEDMIDLNLMPVHVYGLVQWHFSSPA